MLWVVPLAAVHVFECLRSVKPDERHVRACGTCAARNGTERLTCWSQCQGALQVVPVPSPLA